MAKGITDAELAGLGEEERAALEGDEDDTATLRAVAGEGDDGDDDDQAPAPAGSAAPAAKEGEPPPAAAPDAAATDETAAAEAAAEPELVPAPRFSTAPVEDYAGQRSALLDERTELRAQFRAGQITADDHDQKLDEINDKIAALDREQDRAELTRQYNDNIAAFQARQTLDAFMARVARDDKIDYAKSPALLGAFDARLKALAADPANKDRPYGWYLSEAHKQVATDIRLVAAALGLAPAAAGKVAAEAAAATVDPKVRAAIEQRKPNTDGHKSLAGKSAAEAAPAGGSDEGEFAHLSNLEGLALEQALARMPLDAQERYLAGA